MHAAVHVHDLPGGGGKPAGHQGYAGARAPLGWDNTDPEPVARACVALMSGWFPATTGEIVHVDGGVHAVGV